MPKPRVFSRQKNGAEGYTIGKKIKYHVPAKNNQSPYYSDEPEMRVSAEDPREPIEKIRKHIWYSSDYLSFFFYPYELDDAILKCIFAIYRNENYEEVFYPRIIKGSLNAWGGVDFVEDADIDFEHGISECTGEDFKKLITIVFEGPVKVSSSELRSIGI